MKSYIDAMVTSQYDTMSWGDIIFYCENEILWRGTIQEFALTIKQLNVDKEWGVSLAALQIILKVGRFWSNCTAISLERRVGLF